MPRLCEEILRDVWVELIGARVCPFCQEMDGKHKPGCLAMEIEEVTMEEDTTCQDQE